jgi:hypothetical protein
MHTTNGINTKRRMPYSGFCGMANIANDLALRVRVTGKGVILPIIFGSREGGYFLIKRFAVSIGL